MERYQIFFSIFSAVILFLYGLGAFSNELKEVVGDKLQSVVSKLTSNKISAFLVGAFFTLLVQSSTAVSSLTVTFVNTGIITFANSLAVMIGAHVGTTATAWLVSMKLTGLGPLFIVLGTVIGFLPYKIRLFGKAIFYFGFIFFSLDLISGTLAPLRTNQDLLNLLIYAKTPVLGILLGILLTIILQSSTVVTGLAVVFVQQEIIPAYDSIPIVLGANIGTTTTAIVAALRMNDVAKKAAISNFIMVLTGVAIFFPFIVPFSNWVMDKANEPSQAVAIAHLAFNLTNALIFLILLRPFASGMDKIFTKIRS